MLLSFMNARRTTPPPPDVPGEDGPYPFPEPEDDPNAPYINYYYEQRSRLLEDHHQATEARNLSGAIALIFATVALTFALSSNEIIDDIAPDGHPAAQSESSKTLYKHFATGLAGTTTLIGGTIAVGKHLRARRKYDELVQLEDDCSNFIV